MILTLAPKPYSGYQFGWWFRTYLSSYPTPSWKLGIEPRKRLSENIRGRVPYSGFLMQTSIPSESEDLFRHATMELNAFSWLKCFCTSSWLELAHQCFGDYCASEKAAGAFLVKVKMASWRVLNAGAIWELFAAGVHSSARSSRDISCVHYFVHIIGKFGWIRVSASRESSLVPGIITVQFAFGTIGPNCKHSCINRKEVSLRRLIHQLGEICRQFGPFLSTNAVGQPDEALNVGAEGIDFRFRLRMSRFLG